MELLLLFGFGFQVEIAEIGLKDDTCGAVFRITMKNFSPSFLSLCVVLFAFVTVVNAEFTVEKKGANVAVNYDGKLVTEYITDQSNKPFLYPVIGPGGAKMTRAYPMQEVEGERKDHPHHRSVWFGLQNMGGFDTWHEPRTIQERGGSSEIKEKRLAGLGSTVHREFRKLEGGDSAVIVAVNDYVGSNGKKLMSDVRTLTFTMGKDRLILDFDMVFKAEHGDCEVKDMKDSGFCVRVPTSMDVDSNKGGTIVNSEGQTDKAAWGRRATWVSYTGPVDGKTMGIAILNHPSSFRYPTPWHVRTYGLFTANPFGTKSIAKEKDGSFDLKSGDTFSLRHRIIFHEGDTLSANLSGAWEEYSKIK
jgi:hypothetical protein